MHGLCVWHSPRPNAAWSGLETSTFSLLFFFFPKESLVGLLKKITVYLFERQLERVSDGDLPSSVYLLRCPQQPRACPGCTGILPVDPGVPFAGPKYLAGDTELEARSEVGLVLWYRMRVFQEALFFFFYHRLIFFVKTDFKITLSQRLNGCTK